MYGVMESRDCLDCLERMIEVKQSQEPQAFED